MGEARTRDLPRTEHRLTRLKRLRTMSTEQESAGEPGLDPETDQRSGPPQGRVGGGPIGYQPSLEEIFQYLDGHLDEDRQTMMTSHLNQCGGCDDLYHFQVGLKQLLGTRCRSELPADLPQRVFRAITDLS